MKDKGTSRKVTKKYLDFTENLRATRRSKAVGTDKEMLTQMQTGDLLVKYFKTNNDRFMELLKLPMEEKDV